MANKCMNRIILIATVLATHTLLEHADLNFVIDNEAIYGICRASLDIEGPSYSNLNRIASQVIASTTASLRFGCGLNGNLNELQTNLVHHPRMKFVLSSYAPIYSVARRYPNQPSLEDITDSVFKSSSVMASCDPSRGKYMACCPYVQGTNIVPRNVIAAVEKTKAAIQFVDWCPSEVKYGYNLRPPTVVPRRDLLAKVRRAVCMISNSTSVAQVFSRNDHKFDLMYKKRAFIRWYVAEDGDAGEKLSEARQDLATLEDEYKSAEGLMISENA